MLNIFLHFIVSSSVSSGANGGMKFKNTQQKNWLNNLQACWLSGLNPLCRILWLASGKEKSYQILWRIPQSTAAGNTQKCLLAAQ